MEEQNLEINKQEKVKKKISKFVKINSFLLVVSMGIFYFFVGEMVRPSGKITFLTLVLIVTIILIFALAIMALLDIHKNRVKGKIFSWLLMVSSFAFILMVFSILVIIGINTDINKPYKIYRASKLYSSTAESIYKYKCEKVDKIMVRHSIGQSEYNLYCLEYSPFANKECIQNSDCQGGYCISTEGSSFAPKDYVYNLNEYGYIIGKCTKASYKDSNARYEGFVITKPSTINEKYIHINSPIF